MVRLGIVRRADIHFVIDHSEAVRRVVEEGGFAFSVRADDLTDATDALLKDWTSNPPDLFVLDSVDHDRNATVSRLLNQAGIVSLAIVDDPANRSVCADVVVNPLPGLSQAPKLSNAEVCAHRETSYLLGKDYIILAPEFAARHAQPREIRERAAHAFAFFGGADGNNFTPIFFDAVEKIKNLEWTLLIGSLYPHAAWARQEIARRQLPIRPVEQIPDMAQAFFDTDLALVAAGNTLIEAAAVGTPMLAFGQNEIQVENARFFVERCGLPCLGLYGEFGAAELTVGVTRWRDDGAARRALSACLKREIDGRGAERVVEVLQTRLAQRQEAR